MDYSSEQQHSASGIPGHFEMSDVRQTAPYAQSNTWAAGAASTQQFPYQTQPPVAGQYQAPPQRGGPLPQQALPQPGAQFPQHHQVQPQPGAQQEIHSDAQTAPRPIEPNFAAEFRQFMAKYEAWYTAVCAGCDTNDIPSSMPPPPPPFLNQQSQPPPQAPRVEQPPSGDVPQTFQESGASELRVPSTSGPSFSPSQHVRAPREPTQADSRKPADQGTFELPRGYHSHCLVRDTTRANRPVQLVFAEEPEMVVV
ncbi:hypothetical protein AURDEDRAFT_114817, partial [Auricularia subglabra TFB-10046 SS5]